MKESKSDFDFLKKLCCYIDENHMLKNGDKVLVALSGGSDSVCLMSALLSLKEKYNIEVIACHVNHMIRGDEAKRDEDFCKELCKNLGVEILVNRINVPQIAKNEKQSIELAARKARYNWFSEIVKARKIEKIATAHNKNDNAESILMNFMRGAGLSGLSGIGENISDKIIRPILCMEKEEILSYLENKGLSYVTDSTNLSCDYTRNKVRHKLIPFIEENFNPNFVNTITQSAKIIKEDEDFLKKCADEAFSSCFETKNTNPCLNILKLKGYHKAVRYRVIRKMIAFVKGDALDIDYNAVKRIDSLTSGKANILKDLYARVGYGYLYFEKEDKKEDFCLELSLGQEVYIENDKSFVCFKEVAKDDIGKRKNCVWFDIGEAKKLIVRNRKDGDVIKTEGGTKKLKKLFIDEKVDINIRETVPIVELDGEILWVCGIRRSVGHKVTEKTKRAVRLEYVKGEKK